MNYNQLGGKMNQDDSSLSELTERAIELRQEHFKFDQEVILHHKRQWLSSKEKDRLRHLKKMKLSRKDEIMIINSTIKSLRGDS